MDFFKSVILILLKLISSNEPVFISEHPRQRLRKALLDTLFRLPATDSVVKRHERELSILCFKLIETDNEENVQVRDSRTSRTA